MVNSHHHINLTGNDFDDLKVIIFVFKTSSIRINLISSKTKNQKHYSIKIRIKCKKSSQKRFKLPNKQFLNDLKPRNTSKGDFACPKCCLEDRKPSRFCIELLSETKNRFSTTTRNFKGRMYSPGKRKTSTPKKNIHVVKVMFCNWWNHKAVIFLELLKSYQIISGNFHRLQFIHLKKTYSFPNMRSDTSP